MAESATCLEMRGAIKTPLDRLPPIACKSRIAGRVVQPGWFKAHYQIRTPCIRIVYVYYTERTGTVTA
jgi:hypothetical protein